MNQTIDVSRLDEIDQRQGGGGSGARPADRATMDLWSRNFGQKGRCDE